MEIFKAEVDAVALAIESDSEKAPVPLDEIQLAIVGGGCGEVLFG